ncbi:MAG: hypothetical protein HN356_01480 [Calditrichaeota bacterium]|jgi:hypothetical protein|nr:hypothetical protein [Calditrichota bacterium]MBT7616358.1 hypothetical protein [Calditrichota bacterium]MBT7789859.1 hypothetical protein [Calditrichota bacterium]
MVVWDESAYHTSPVIDVTLAGTPVTPIVARFDVSSSLLEKAETVVLELADYNRIITGSVKRGDQLFIKWGYVGQEMVEIFRGVVRSIGVDDPVVIRGIDYNAILNSKRIQKTFEDETASGIIRAVMAGTGLGLEIEECAVEIDRLPLFNQTLRESLDTITEIVKTESREQYYDYIREGILHWGKKEISGEAQCAFRLGYNIIRQEVCPDGVEFLETLVTPVRHSEIIEVEGEKMFVVKVEYLWEGGGRTRIWYEHAG